MNILHSLLNFLRPKPDDFLSSIRPASEVSIRCNGFMRDFIESDLDSIEIAEATFGTDVNPVLKHLRGGSYREIRNRLKILSNLDPVVNRKEESGRIRVSYRTDETDESENAPFRDAELRTLFPADQSRFVLHKVNISPVHC